MPVTPHAYDLVLTGGRVLDPASNTDARLDIGISDGVIAAIEPDLAGEDAYEVIDCRDQLLTPGLVDVHTHVYPGSTVAGLDPDEVGVRSGNTTVCDQGSAGRLTFAGLRDLVIPHAATDVYAFLGIRNTGGLLGPPLLSGPDNVDVDETVACIARNRSIIRGVKTHAELGGYSRWGIDVLRLAIEAAEQTALPVYVHTGSQVATKLMTGADGATVDPDDVLGQAMPLLRPGDVIAHPFVDFPDGILDRRGKVRGEVVDALDRGVRVDVGHGVHLSYETARKVLDQGVVPFLAGSDVHGDFAGYHYRGTIAYSLATTLSELLALGLPLLDVVAMATTNPAELLGLSDRIGQLAVGRPADVSVVHALAGPHVYRDGLGAELVADARLVPVLTVKAGAVTAVNPFLLAQPDPYVGRLHQSPPPERRPPGV